MLRVDYEDIPGLWVAYDDDAYDCATDSQNVVGFGKTSAEAIADYENCLIEREDYLASLKEKA